MRHYAITGHARISEGISSAVELILGVKLPYFNAYLSGGESYEEQMKGWIESFPKSDEIVILTDVMGGSVNNEMMRLVEKNHIHLVCGTNLALAMQLVLSDENRDVNEVIQESIEEAKEGICYCNTCETKEELDEF